MIERITDISDKHHFFLFGPRQTGKSTLLASRFKKEHTLFINLLESDTFSTYTINPAQFREVVNTRSPSVRTVIVDEIQRIPELLNEIHLIMESPNSPIFGLSGSSARKLKRAHANMLGGRAWTFHLYPFTHNELGNQFSLQKALERGTIPSIYLEESEKDAQRSLKSYVETYLKEEIQAEALVRNIGSFMKFLPLAADSNGKILNYSNIARETGTSGNTVKEYFQILEDTLLGFKLLPWSRSSRKQLSRHPKFYLFDTGVQRTLLQKNSVPLLPKTFEYGAVFKHFLLLEFVRLSSCLERDYRFSYYRTSNNAEVDLIIQTPEEKIYALEIKSTDSPSLQTVSGLKSFKTECDSAELFCVCRCPHPFSKNGITFLPWRQVFQLLNLI